MFNFNDIQFDDDSSNDENTGGHAEIPVRPRTSWDGGSYDRSYFVTQQCPIIPPGAFPPSLTSKKTTTKTTGTPTRQCTSTSEDFYRGVTENSDLQSLVNPSNVIGGEMLAMKQHQRNLSNNNNNNNNTAPTFSRISSLDEDDDTDFFGIGNKASLSSNNVEGSGNSSPMTNAKGPYGCNFGTTTAATTTITVNTSGTSGYTGVDENDYPMRASRSSLDSSLQRRNFNQYYYTYGRGNPNFSSPKGNGVLDGLLRFAGCSKTSNNSQQPPPQPQQQLQQQQQIRQFGKTQQTYQQVTQQFCQQQQPSLQYQLSAQRGYLFSGRYGGGCGWNGTGNVLSVPSMSLHSSGVNSPYYDSYHSSGYASMSGSSSASTSAAYEQPEFLNDPRELEKIRRDTARNSSNSSYEEKEINDVTTKLDRVRLLQPRMYQQSQNQNIQQQQQQQQQAQLQQISSQQPQSPSQTPPPPLSSSSSSSSLSSSSPQQQQQQQQPKKKLVIQKPKNRIAQKSPLTQKDNVTQSLDLQTSQAQQQKILEQQQQQQQQQQPQQQQQKKKRNHRGGRRGTRVMREAKEKRLAALREAGQLVDESKLDSPQTKAKTKTTTAVGTNKGNKNNLSTEDDEENKS